ncbi:hypothetical protein C8J57DRAFT_1211068 [Mycena rebaudengoi]|nr:hypothetical protein C8J57DRAFT_1211068 [Mycena rebaudengoi]
MDFVQGLDPGKLILGLTSLSFIISPFSAPPYNFPLFLFGLLAQQQESSDGQALQIFTAMLGASGVLDIIWMLMKDHEQHGFIRFLTILLLFLKFPTFVAFGLALRQRGAIQFSGRDLGGATVWDSMPGGFGVGNNGYQNVDEERPAQYARPAPPPAMPAAQPAQPPAQQPAAAPGSYQTV